MNARAGINSLIGLAAMAVSCAAIHALAPLPEMPEVTAKLAYFARHKNEFDVLFVGSSRIYHQVSPKLFDRIAHESGADIHSFNLGFDAMLPPETFYMVEKILAGKPRRLRWMFVEIAPMRGDVLPGGNDTARALYWHDWRRTLWACRSALAATGAKQDAQQKVLSARQARDFCLLHVRLFLKNFANLGRGFELATPKNKKSGSNQQIAKVIGADGDGFLPEEKDSRSAATPAVIESRLAQLKKEKPVPRREDLLTEKAFAENEQRIRAAGATPILLIPPTMLRLPAYTATRRDTAHVFAFDDIDAFPMFYETKNRYDAEHLNPAGAEIFTRLLARRFCDQAFNRH
jgi:hypothetical protein